MLPSFRLNLNPESVRIEKVSCLFPNWGQKRARVDESREPHYLALFEVSFRTSSSFVL